MACLIRQAGLTLFPEPAIAMLDVAAERPPAMLPSAGEAADWVIGDGPVAYPEAVTAMEARVAAIRAGEAREMAWLVEHPPLYTAGTSAKPADLLAPDRFPVYRTGRGGQYTYHGPGQRVAYLMLDLNRRQPDLRLFVRTLEEWVIRTLAAFNVKGEPARRRIGIWVARPDKGIGREDKIAAIGIRVRRWVTFHGIAINVDPGAGAFLRHRALRHQRSGRHQPRRSRHPVAMAEVDSGAAARIRGAVRGDG